MNWLSSLGSIIGRIVTTALSGSATAPVATIGPVTLTAGEARAALGGLASLGIAIQHIVDGTATLADDEVVAIDILQAAAMIDPALLPVVAVATALEPLLNDLIATGFFNGIHGDPDPIHDAQTTRQFNPMDPAGRL